MGGAVAKRAMYVPIGQWRVEAGWLMLGTPSGPMLKIVANIFRNRNGTSKMFQVFKRKNIYQQKNIARSDKNFLLFFFPLKFAIFIAHAHTLPLIWMPPSWWIPGATVSVSTVSVSTPLA